MKGGRGRGCCSFLYVEFVPHWQRMLYSVVRTDLLDCSGVEISHSITELKKRTWVYKKRSSTWVLYFFIIRELFFEGTSKSSTAFFTVCGPDCKRLDPQVWQNRKAVWNTEKTQFDWNRYRGNRFHGNRFHVKHSFPGHWWWRSSHPCGEIRGGWAVPLVWWTTARPPLRL